MHLLQINGQSILGQWDALYARYLKEILRSGDTFMGRNGETKSVFGSSITVDLKYGFPLTRLRKMPRKNLFREMLFDIGFDQNVDALGPAKHFWSFLADENGYLGASAYNRQWRMWPASKPGSQVENENLSIVNVDQMQRVIELLRETPNSRHGTVITSNPTAIKPGCPPCHLAMQFMPRPNGDLDMMVPARSNDMVVGFPLDIARYAIITEVIARATGFTPGRVYMPSANSHIYENCYNIAEDLIKLQAMPECKLVISEEWDHQAKQPLEGLVLEHFSVEGYEPHDSMKVEVN